MKFGYSGNNDSSISRSTLQDKIFKLVIVGNQNVGKTSLITRYSENTFSDEKVKTFGRCIS